MPLRRAGTVPSTMFVAAPALQRTASRRATRCAASGERSRALLLKLAGLAEAPEILRRDGFQRIRGDAETLQGQSRGARGIGYDVVDAQQFDLVRRKPQRARGELQEKRLQPGEP